ncbi:anthranilate phosphoribosyltransferase [Kangiella sediminilitoris]|uniref:Anthranilate phosphoribosyltransferase n=1 Tax=Kangiella sediminilitoris TaxID=1144748 RepID=A0A1B3BBA9_9GAMM|nr:anthranilate phosphoribosyltransferase [Kangiella sediminilitoris]AOE50082.1 anthranilate phosphoribosyltransferase [Kangiella sediminilitoris]
MLNLLENVYQGRHLNFEQASCSFREVLKGDIEIPVVAAMLAALKTKGETVEEIAGAAAALRHEAQYFPPPQYSVSDCCGTGGDGLNTINVSTLVSIVAASAGVKIVKHGNRSVSSNCGSADLMEQLGVNINLSAAKSKELLDSANFCFLFAPEYHQGVKHVMPVRQSLKTRTIFNLIGPLANPALPDVQLLGVYDEQYLEPFAEILKLLGTRKALIVHGSGLDEIAVHGQTKAVSLNNGVITMEELTPEDFSAKRHSLSDIQTSKDIDNKTSAIKLLTGKGTEAHIDMVAVNSSALLVLNDLAGSYDDGYQIARDLIQSGKALQQLEKIKELSHG